MPAPSDDRLLFQLKTRGPQTAAELGARLGMTATGARQHLARLKALGLVEGEGRRQARGRPGIWWQLTARGHGRFPDRHADLTLDLLRSTAAVFGRRGLDRLIRHRERTSLAQYRAALAQLQSLRARLTALAQLRSREGYMASVVREAGGSFLLVEDHCPICAAAATCQGLCRSELAIFRRVLGPDTTVERVDHLLAGARRCAYRVTLRGPPDPDT